MVASGGNYYGQAGQSLSESFMVEDGTYFLKIEDSFGDGRFLEEVSFIVKTACLIH